ncbi:uncharacterized protein LOC133197990 [Saccostrea echinata]|uniref:uncharacterized protein LOC133197990 n=1 Tax=Saccostrea echinata TaxID=191078 RepID=UPI002A802D83|nr:uncharacterized protein LOC133197990 [Saccostrea echinata]
MASLKHLSNRDTTNFARVCRLVSVCADLLRDVLLHFVSVMSLYSELDRAKEKFMKILNPQQKILLYKKRKSFLPYDDLDISLLYLIIRNLCDESLHTLSNGQKGMTSPKEGWGKEPTEKDRSLAANIERIRLFRNDICHRENASMANPEFSFIWTKMSRVVEEIEKELGNKVNPTKHIDLLKTIRSISMDPEEAQKYIKELEKMKEEKEGLEERLNLKIEELKKEIVNKDLARIIKNPGLFDIFLKPISSYIITKQIFK